MKKIICFLFLLFRVFNGDKNIDAVSWIDKSRYADDFVLMGQKIDDKCLCKLKEVLNRMDLTINETKSKLVQGQETPFNFLGFTVRYDRSIYNRDSRFWNIIPSEKSRKKVRQTIKAKLKTTGHYPPEAVVDELNPIIRGWINYYSIEKVSYMQVDKRKLTSYLRDSLTRYYNRKSQRRSRMYGRHAFDILVKKYGLINPYRSLGKCPVYA